MLSSSAQRAQPFAPLPSMGDEEFVRWVDLLERRTGVLVPAGRKSFLVTGLRMRMRETGYDDFQNYFDEVLNGARGAMEWATLVDRLTVHETRFFRHEPSYDLIAGEWLPEVARPGASGAIHAWSVGCATGEEAYSLAMVLDRGLRSLGDHRVYFGVTATDISNPALGVGRAATYPRDRLTEIPEPFRSEYTEPVGGDAFAIVDSLRKRVGFALFNLLEVARAPLKQLDLIYCQNVFIYFARERRKRMLEALAARLKPGGLLVLGPGGITGFTDPSLTRVGGRQTLAYQRLG
ncbi:MAG: CheR family methyltransferase [Pseudomonadota bacterium]|nr:CheR family methyltransferase [Pseudomonadota bacterium]